MQRIIMGHRDKDNDEKSESEPALFAADDTGRPDDKIDKKYSDLLVDHF